MSSQPETSLTVIGCVLQRGAGLFGDEPFYEGVLDGIKAALDADRTGGLTLVRIAGATAGQDLDIYRTWWDGGLVDGVILFDLMFDDPRPALLRELGMPFVIHGVLRGETAQAALFEQTSDAATLVDHLADLGHRTIAHVTGPMHIAHETDRNARVISAGFTRGLEVVTVESDYTTEGGRHAALTTLSQRADVSGFIASNDLLAVGIQGAVKAFRRDRTTAIVSWDDSAACATAPVRITALDRHTDEAGRRSARRLLQLVAGRRCDERDLVPVPSTLSVRQTSVCGPGRSTRALRS